MNVVRGVLGIAVAVSGLGCASVDAYREAMPAHPGLSEVLDADVAWGGAEAGPVVFSGDAEAHLVEGGRPPAPTPRVGPIAQPVLYAPASLAVVELAAYTERGALPWHTGAAVWEPTPWRPVLQAPSVDALRKIRVGLLGSAAVPTEGWPALGGAALDPFAHVDAIPSFLLSGGASLPAIRAAAAGVGCEVVLVYARRTRILEGHNACAALYPLLIGLALPAKETRVQTRYEAALLDVRSGQVLAVAQGEARAGWSSVPLAGGLEAGSEELEDCESEALQGVLAELRQSLAHLQGQGRLRPRAPR